MDMTRKYFNFQHMLSNGEIRDVEVYSGSATPFQCGGKLLGMVQSFKDISERKQSEEILRESENRYRSLFELSPDAIIVYCQGIIVFANSMAAHLFGENFPENLIGKNVYQLFHPDFRHTARLRIEQALSLGKTESMYHYKLIKKDGTIFDGEASSNSLLYKGQLAVQTIIRDITRQKKEIETAAKIQKQRLSSRFPFPEKAQMEIVYLPAETISGDLFHLQKYDDYTVVGFLGDVAGKGISAALSTSALKVLFYEICYKTKNPLELLKILNIEVGKYLQDEYVAACCFSFDFLQKQFTVAGAGINLFSFSHKGFYCCQEIIKGPFLGMFTNVKFDVKNINFERGDRFYLYTDGFLDFLHDKETTWIFDDCITIQEQKRLLEDNLRQESSLKDDTTWLAIEIK